VNTKTKTGPKSGTESLEIRTSSSCAAPGGLETDERIVAAWVAKLGLESSLSARPSAAGSGGWHNLESELRGLLEILDERKAMETGERPEENARPCPDHARLLLRQGLRSAILELARQPEVEDPALLDALDTVDHCLPAASEVGEGSEDLRHSWDSGGEIDAIIQRLPVAIWIYDSAGNLLSMNAAAATTIGTTLEEVRPLNLFRDVAPRRVLASPGGVPLRVEEFPLVRALNGETIHRQEMVVRATGKQGNYLVDAAPLRDSEGRVHAAMAVLIETTDQKRMPAELSASVAAITSLGERTPLLMWRCTPDGTYNYLNMAWLEFTGRPLAQAVGDGWADSVHPDDRGPRLRAHRNAIRHATPFEITYRLRRHDGVYRWLTDHATPIHDESGRFLGFAGSCVDISERVASLAELEIEHERIKDASRRKSRVLTALSHDLRTPLNAVALSSEILCLMNSDRRENETRECCETIRHSVRNVMELLDDLLDLNRVEAGDSAPNPSLFPIAPALEEVFAPAEFEARTKGLEAVLDCSCLAGMSLEADRAKLKRILANLLSNAVRYTSRGSVTLRAALDGQDLRFSVEDTGIGIAEADLDRIFEEYIRLNEDREQPRSGSGLGLAIARRLAHVVGGRIELESVPGLGSQFTLALPRALLRPAGPVATAAPRSDAAPHAGLTRNNRPVLVVETDPASRRLLAKLLGWAELRVVTAADWGEVLAAAERESPCVLLLDDRVVPDSDLARLQTVRQAPDGEVTPVILIADHATPKIERALRSGAVEACITRPVHWEELRTALLRVVRKSAPAAGERPPILTETTRSVSDGP
jgi:PAS domain S-box-containing protein